ncbi:MAG TPA: cupin domain-containing protein [Terriglobales bacterium]|nr:cupin domain-containing protein [Terriglobales bacterium]
MDIEVIDLIAQATDLPPDNEKIIGPALTGDLLLIRLEPGTYPIECHEGRTEIITALRGHFGIVATDGRSWQIAQGQCCRIPPGLQHHWAPDSDATVLVAFATG